MFGHRGGLRRIRHWHRDARLDPIVPAVEYMKAKRARTVLRMDGYTKPDAILSPGDMLSAVANLTGHPALPMTCAIVGGRSRPLVIAGRLYDEATICRIALADEQVTEWSA
jgi:Asp-tRNA(Asn)/Glu-tRNA(Gln) amidotransferase A subunit family amidase